jgi:hypothetical protein
MDERKKCKKIVVRMAHSALLLCLSVSLAVAQQTGEIAQPAPADPTGQAVPSLTQLPDSPGTTLAKLQAPNSPQAQQDQTQQDQSQSQQPSTEPPSAQSSSQQSDTSRQAPQRPVGTAAAGPTHAAGIAASQPAGVAIAPAKQHRTRTIIIRVGAVVGAAVAIGTVVALTAATSSKPPGAH